MGGFAPGWDPMGTQDLEGEGSLGESGWVVLVTSVHRSYRGRGCELYSPSSLCWARGTYPGGRCLTVLGGRPG